MTELAFLRAFLAWESFLEESFVLYATGQLAPSGKPPRRLAFPPTAKHAREWVKPEGRAYASWTNGPAVCTRAKRFFHQGLPFAAPLVANQNALEEATTIRNAIAHESASAKEKFENLVRRRLGSLPAKATVGGFLATIDPKSAPPQTFLEYHLGTVETAAEVIVQK